VLQIALRDAGARRHPARDRSTAILPFKVVRAQGVANAIVSIFVARFWIEAMPVRSRRRCTILLLKVVAGTVLPEGECRNRAGEKKS
jgi:hypothetical protein